MIIPTWHEEAIARHHDRKSFDCGNADLNRFLWEHARKNHEQGASKTFLAMSSDDQNTILGYYSLSPVSIEFARAPAAIIKGLPRHDVPMFRLGRLAVSIHLQGKGLIGGQLLLAAGRRCLRVADEVGGVAMFIDAKNERVAKWYQSYGAIPLNDPPLSLILPFQTIRSALQIK
ncbi:N-acetyltransferase [Asticcacaulis benevestitus]|uniref:N-acetyltransferase domain-containing protein n=1 Tax=Asticcacaulis benevestitus DSM 16100 = ATCC BAA-896 TaxID=1121022 RepID=V4PRM6_9CAUL|nr:N-acetyltransferase [Asticcacaulis benevestitus]ESQ90966.1 hypothetical protein ABENE_10980 [Asticcacaulis benevestitus DSM 16100 = ATCC BAA-896]